ncbi:MAG: hypothetical protein E6I48_15970 [Chloroflexi bacterium]|nr:MAG: hypothetical protein E6I48_15970 [Chloroflexota bacterium]
MFTIDPDVPLAVGFVIAAVAVCSGALAAALLLSVPEAGRGRQKRAVAPALRRGAELTAIIALLLLLRVVDGLTPITGGFIVLGFFVAEVILSARPTAPSR